MRRQQDKSAGRPGSGRAWLIASLVFTLSILATFKYAAFLQGALLPFTTILAAGPLPLSDLLLPLGISFYSFQLIGLHVDIYRGAAYFRPLCAFRQLFSAIDRRANSARTGVPASVNSVCPDHHREKSTRHLVDRIRFAEKSHPWRFPLRAARGTDFRRSGYHKRTASFTRDLRFCLPDLFRLFGLYRYGPRHRSAAWIRVPQELRGTPSFQKPH